MRSRAICFAVEFTRYPLFQYRLSIATVLLITLFVHQQPFTILQRHFPNRARLPKSPVENAHKKQKSQIQKIKGNRKNQFP